MKKIILLAFVAILGITACNAQSKKAKVQGAGIVFENETIDYGTIPHNSDGNRQFVFTNNGNKPLIITNTQGSCGCTVPTTPKEPIAPGEKGQIKVQPGYGDFSPSEEDLNTGILTFTSDEKGIVEVDSEREVGNTPSIIHADKKK